VSNPNPNPEGRSAAMNIDTSTTAQATDRVVTQPA
jgi:hypothetical protein